MKKVLIFGASGSIGHTTLKLAAAHPDKFNIVGVSAGARFEALKTEAKSLQIEHWLNTKDEPDIGTITSFIQTVKPDIVLNAVSGFAGLPYTLATLQLETPLALANKESLVAAGEMVMQLSKERRAPIYPVDSEHSAIWQCLSTENNYLKPFKKIYLTCSGGPFLGEKNLKKVKHETALKHPNWNMGTAITVDSATLANKCLEFFEAMHLFGAQAEQIEIVIHPQSVVHSMVEFTDSSIMAQLSPPSMELPIAYALSYPDRKDYHLPTPDFSALSLDFQTPNKKVFTTLKTLEYCSQQMHNFPIVFNAVNEEARNAFIKQQIPFHRIFEILESVIQKTKLEELNNLAHIYEVDKQARQQAQALL